MDHRELVDKVEEMGPISDINVTPFIDIMLVLLVIFMVTAPLMLGGVYVNLPKTKGDPIPRPHHPVVVSLDAANQVFVGQEMVLEKQRHEIFQHLARESESGEVFVHGDGEVKYYRLMNLMTELGQAGFTRVTLVANLRGKTGGAGTSGTVPIPEDAKTAPEKTTDLAPGSAAAMGGVGWVRP